MEENTDYIKIKGKDLKIILRGWDTFQAKLKAEERRKKIKAVLEENKKG